MIQNRLTCALVVAALTGICGCTTTAAKKAMNKPEIKDSYSGFDKDAGEESVRKAEKVEPVKEDSEPQEAVDKLVTQLQGAPAAIISAEAQLEYWGRKQGVDQMIVRKVRPLLKNPRVETRAPALRLTAKFGKAESCGDLIECMADSEHSMREMAYKSLRVRAHRDFGYDPSGGELARAESVDRWRQWWQDEQRRGAVQPPSVYETNPPSEPQIVHPGEEKKKNKKPENDSGEMYDNTTQPD